MKLLWSFLLVLSLVFLSNVSHGLDEDEDDDTDGVVEDIPDENIVREKVMCVERNFGHPLPLLWKL